MRGVLQSVHAAPLIRVWLGFLFFFHPIGWRAGNGMGGGVVEGRNRRVGRDLDEGGQTRGVSVRAEAPDPRAYII